MTGEHLPENQGLPQCGWPLSECPVGFWDCQILAISSLSEWECYNKYFVVWVYARCFWGMCRSLICIQTWCRDWHRSPRDPRCEPDTMTQDIWVISLGKRMSIFCPGKESASFFWWLEGQTVLVTFSSTIYGFLHSLLFQGLLLPGWVGSCDKF